VRELQQDCWRNTNEIGNADDGEQQQNSLVLN